MLEAEAAIAAATEAYLDEAEKLVADGHPEMAVVRAVSAFEFFMKRAFIEPYLRVGLLGGDAELAAILVDPILRSHDWRRRLGLILKTCWKINVDRMDGWSSLSEAWSLRNKIAHDGGRCDAHAATRCIGATRTVITALLLARCAAAESVAGDASLAGAVPVQHA